MKKRIISLALTLCMVFTLMPTAVSAAEVESETTTVTSATESTTAATAEATTAATTTAVATTATTAGTTIADTTVAETTVDTTKVSTTTASKPEVPSVTDVTSAAGTEATGTIATTAKSASVDTTTAVTSPTDTVTDIPAASSGSSIFTATTTAKPKTEIVTPKTASATDVDAVKKVQLLINSLPDGENITESNRETVEKHLEAIDEARLELEDDECDKLDFTKYNAAVAALYKLDGMESADIPTTLADDTATLQSKLDEGGTVKLDRDYTISSPLDVDEWNVTLDLNGYVLKMTGTGCVISISSGLWFTLDDSNPSRTHTDSSLPVGGVITGGNGTNCGGIYGYIQRDSALTPHFVMNGGTIYNCKAEYGSAVSIAGKFEMNGGKIEGNTCTLDTNIKDVNAAEMQANGGTIKDDVWIDRLISCKDQSTCTKFYGSVQVNKYGTFSGGVFYNTITCNEDQTISGGVFYGGINTFHSVSGTRYDVTFDTAGGSGTFPTQVFVNTSTAKALKPTTDPTKPGCKFLGWYNGDTKYTFTENVTSNITLTAKWEEPDLKLTGDGLIHGTDYTYVGNVLTILSSKEMTIENKDKTAKTAHTIVVAKNVSANITLAGVNIDVSNTGVVGKSSGLSAFSIESGSEGNVKITLKDGTENTLKSGVSRAGIEKNGTGNKIGNLTITGSGTLKATGGNDAAGIGAEYGSSTQNITITGGTIIASGSAAGIGGSKNNHGSDITITGGNITATSSWGGAGIGGGYNGKGYDIKIFGGTVNATGGKHGAGIGGGYEGNGYNIVISDGDVTAYGGESGAGIGGGNRGNGTNITINTGNVTAIGGKNSAGIGGGGSGKGYDIKIAGGKVIANGGENGAGIGGGYKGKGYDISVSGGAVEVQGGTNAAGIGGGTAADGYNISIKDGTISIIAGMSGTGIGGGGYDTDNYTPGTCENVVIDGGSLKITLTPNLLSELGTAIGYGMKQGGGATAVTPVNSDNKYVYPITIANGNSKTVYIDGDQYNPCNHTALDSSDTNLYAYITGEHHNVKVGDATSCYHFGTDFVLCTMQENYGMSEDTHWSLCSDSDCTVKHNEKTHSFDWKYDDENYWEECTVCGYKKNVKPLPNVEISCSDAVCKAQNLKVSFKVPNGVAFVRAGYDFEHIGGDLSCTVNGDTYSCVISSPYPEDDSICVYFYATSADGCTFKVEKKVRIQSEHSGGTADCCNKASCEVCGEEYGDIDNNNHPNLRHVKRKPATTKKAGNIEYWHCPDCDRYFSDENLTTEITQAQTVIPKLEGTTPKTGDTNAAPFVSVMLISAAVMVALVDYERRRKLHRENNGK